MSDISLQPTPVSVIAGVPAQIPTVGTGKGVTLINQTTGTIQLCSDPNFTTPVILNPGASLPWSTGTTVWVLALASGVVLTLPTVFNYYDPNVQSSPPFSELWPGCPLQFLANGSQALKPPTNVGFNTVRVYWNGPQATVKLVGVDTGIVWLNTTGFSGNSYVDTIFDPVLDPDGIIATVTIIGVSAPGTGLSLYAVTTTKEVVPVTPFGSNGPTNNAAVNITGVGSVVAIGPAGSRLYTVRLWSAMLSVDAGVTGDGCNLLDSSGVALMNLRTNPTTSLSDTQQWEGGLSQGIGFGIGLRLNNISAGTALCEIQYSIDVP